ncbi:MAG: hypothetical protein P8129_18785, partial [Anaerolineae bacterium]
DKPLVFPEHREPDLTRDRLCEIRPTGLDDGVEDEFEFVMHFQVHPGVSQGRRDIYVSSRNSTGVSANLTCVSGDPDLYLARGGDPIDSSTRGTGSDESVSGSWGSGKWRVHVYGYTTAQYQLSAGWVYDKTKTGLPPAFGG